MSRSHKKNFIIKDHDKQSKHLANRKVRAYLKNNNISLNNSDYRKVFESYDISDFKFCRQHFKQNYDNNKFYHK